MKHRMMSVWVSAIFAAVVLVCVASHTQAANILVSGNSMNQSNPNLTGAIAGLGHTAVFVAPVNFAGTSLAGFDAVWLDGFSQYGTGSWPANLLAFMNSGGNVFVQNPGFGSEAMSLYPLGAQLTANFTFPPGADTISIVDATSPLGANHAVNAGLTGAGLSGWVSSSAFGYFSNIGAFSGLTNTGTLGQSVTIVAKVGSGYLVYTQQGVSQYLSSAANPGSSSEAARFLDNVVTLRVLATPTLALTLTGCTTCQTGDRFTVQARVTNTGPRDILVEAKAGVRLPDGTTVNVLGNNHLEVSMPTGLDSTLILFDVPSWPPGLPTGLWTFEGTLLGRELGETFSRVVKPFVVVP